jgi:ATP-binding cassette subfamily B protein
MWHSELIQKIATAFADPESKHLTYKAFAALSEGKTTLIIAHRLTSVVGADQIWYSTTGKSQIRGRIRN